jgi:hypothetical protein
MDYRLRQRYHSKNRYASTILTISVVALLLAACRPGAGQAKHTQITPTPIQTPDPSPDPQVNSSRVRWPAFDGGGSRSGVNNAETKITAANVNTLTRLWQVHLSKVVDSSPIELPQVQTVLGVKDLLFMTTRSGTLLAMDAASGKVVWQQTTQGPKITNSSPVLDPSGQYVYSYGLDGKVHKYAVGTGQEITGKGWPATITLMNQVEKGSSAMNIDDDSLYVTTSGYIGDGGHYEGHVVAVNLATGNESIFNSLCANVHTLLNTTTNYCPSIQSGIWGRGGAVIDPVTGNIFVTTGNGPYTANRGGYDYGDSVIELTPDLSKVVDSYTPTNYQYLNDADRDLGSDAPALLPAQKGSKIPYLAVQGGKDNRLRVLNRQNLSGVGSPNHVGGEIQTIVPPNACDVDTQPAVWNDSRGTTWVFVANNCGFAAFRAVTDASGNTTLQLAYHTTMSGSSPFIANNILFLESSRVIRALDPTTGNVLWSSTQSSARGTIGPLHWQSPIVVNGCLFVPDNSGYISAYGLS